MIWIERQRHFLDFTLSSLWRRRWKNLSLLFVYTLVVFLISSVIFFTGALREEAKTILQGTPEMIVQRIIAGRHSLIPYGYQAAIRDIRGVQSVKPRLWGYYYHPAARANYTLMVPDTFPFEDDQIKVGQGVLRTWGKALGDPLYFKSFDGEALVLSIVETFTSASELATSDLILVSEKTFRKLSGVPSGFATDLAVSIRNQRESATIIEKVSTALPDTRPILREEILRTYASLFDWRGGFMIVLLAGAFMAFFVFAWDKATGLSAEEKSEIAILKGLGWDTSDVLVMKFWEGTVVSMAAFLLGVTFAYVHTYMSSAPLFEPALKGWGTLYPSFRLRPAIDGYQLANLFFLTVVPYAFITLIPAWKVASSDPDRVMRQG